MATCGTRRDGASAGSNGGKLFSILITTVSIDKPIILSENMTRDYLKILDKSLHGKIVGPKLIPNCLKCESKWKKAHC